MEQIHLVTPTQTHMNNTRHGKLHLTSSIQACQFYSTSDLVKKKEKHINNIYIYIYTFSENKKSGAQVRHCVSLAIENSPSVLWGFLPSPSHPQKADIELHLHISGQQTCFHYLAATVPLYVSRASVDWSSHWVGCKRINWQEMASA